MRRRTFLSLPLALAAPVVASPAGADFAGRVIHVASGQRLKVMTRDGVRVVRLRGVSAPLPGTPYGNHARQALGDLIFGRTVTVSAPSRAADGTLRARVVLFGQDVAAAMVAGGHVRADPGASTAAAYRGLESRARAARRGLWGRTPTVRGESD